MDTVTFDLRRSLEIGRGRAVAVLEQLFDASDMDDLAELCRNRKVLSRVLCKMVRRRQVYVIAVQLDSFVGPPRKVYCRRKVYAPDHDNALTKVKRALGWPDGERAHEIEPVNGVTPDWVTFFPRRRIWEMDTGTEGYDEITKKVEAYRLQDRAVLWVCPTDARRRWLVEKTGAIADRSFFALWREVVERPQGDVWMTATGVRKALTFVATEVANDVA